MQASKGFVHMPVLLAVLLIVGAGATIAYQSTTKSKSDSKIRGSESVGTQENAQPVDNQSAKAPESGETVLKTHTNTSVGFKFNYPAAWKVEDSFTKNSGGLNIFSSSVAYSSNEQLKQGVMKAQFLFENNPVIDTKGAYISQMIAGNKKDVAGGLPTGLIDEKSVADASFNSHAVFYKGGTGEIGYVIPLKAGDYSEVLHIIVWNADQDKLEEVLATVQTVR